MKSQVVIFVCSVLMDLMLMSETSRLPLDQSPVQPAQPLQPLPAHPGPDPISSRAADLNTAPTTNSESFSLSKGLGNIRRHLFERYSSSTFGGLFPQPYWNNRNNYNSWPYPYTPGFQPNPGYNPANPYDAQPYNPYYPYNYFGSSYGSGGNYGSSAPIGAIGSAKPGTSKISKT
nr:PREDICTED: uncharacterized protein LOC109030720 isoform X1 [Bemisia tabaci]